MNDIGIDTGITTHRDITHRDINTNRDMDRGIDVSTNKNASTETNATTEKDSLPDDLRHDYYEKQYECPNNNRRRIPGFLYLAIGVFSITINFITSENSILVNQGFTAAGIVLILFGLYNIQASWNLQVDARDAVKAASCIVDFPIGHVSTQLAWRGLRSRPTWRLVLYSGEPEPARRGLVLVDGVDNTVVEHFTETL